MTNTALKLYLNSSTKYLMRSASTVTILTNNVEIVACLDFSEGISAVKTLYYHATNELFLPSGAAHPVRFVAPGQATTVADTCTMTTYRTGTHDLLIDTGELAASAITCPDPLLANFNNYTVNMLGTAYCTASGGYIHICSDTDTVEVEYSVCPTVIFYSTEGTLQCVYYTNSSTTYYVNLLNMDSSVDNTVNYHYTCLVIDYTESPVFMTQIPRKCASDQTATTLPASGGATFELYANVPGSSSGIPIPLIYGLAAAGGLFFLVVCSVVFYYFCIRKGYTLPCCKNKRKQQKKKQQQRQREAEEKRAKKSGKVAPVDTVSVEDSLGVPMDAKSTGLQATAIITPNDGCDVMSDGRRWLETAQSTRSVVTPSHVIQTDLVLDEQTPRRLPALEPITPAHGHLLLSTNEGGDDLNVSVTRKLPPINESSSLQS
ncbi:hypothetical protein EGW08_012558 [Elysia chlorotica]|uniref:DUF7042 domain-containing protein n=1 Tax=Elysia chlorotica TaxID=188477 RepID=A0A433TDW9_ELYCH|nr:hypothetical protein EGW08_012558 [Elysia chlorotica]